MIPVGTCICIKCLKEKDNIEYPYIKKLNKNGFFIRNNNTCKKCISFNQMIIYKLKKEYPRPELGTICDCCNKSIIKYNDFQLDHDHKTNFFRGWICRKCNVGIGNLGDTEESLIKVLKYIK